MTAIIERLGLRRRRLGNPGVEIDLDSTVVGYSCDRRGWDNVAMRVLDPIDAASARSAHLIGRTYSVVRREAGQLIVVAFLNHHEITVSRYHPSDTIPIETRELREVDGRMWLRGIKRCNGDHTVPAEQQVTDWFTWVRPDTTATWTRFDHGSPQGRPHEVRLEWDPTTHWHERPEFGDDPDLIGAPDLLERLWPSAGPLPIIDDQAPVGGV